jgi:hypothetical protein
MVDGSVSLITAWWPQAIADGCKERLEEREKKNET